MSAVETIGERITLTAGADLSAAQKLFLKHDATNDHSVIKAVDAAAPILGVCTFPDVSGGAVTVQISGVARVLAGAAVAAGDRVTADSAGKAVTLATSVGLKYMAGIALEAAAAADIEIAVLLAQAPVNSAVS